MKKQVLIVEDEPDCAELLRYHLQKEDYEAVIARNGEEAIEATQCHAPDAVLLDVMLSELDGWEVCRILRESSKGRSLPIIMLTALSDEEARVKGLGLGADDYITKPYSMQELLLKVRRQIDRQRTVNQLKAREQERDAALRYLVHELQNALTAIGGFSSLALRKDETNRFLKTINTAAVHAESLLNDASLLSRLETGEGPLEQECVSVGPLVREAAEFFHDTAKRKSLEVITVNDTASIVRCNRTALRQVLINLIANAVKYSREGGKIWISFNENSGEVNVSIKDEGPGIRENELARIFDKFYRASGSEPVKGAGLGLYIVRLLLTAMGGRIAAASQWGAGSAFTVTLHKADEEVQCIG